MATRYLYIARHGDADAFGDLTDTGREQARLLGQRLAHLPIGAIWHSPLPRAGDSAEQLNIFLAGAAPVRAAEELIDNIPSVPKPEETPQPWEPFFDGFDRESAEAGRALAQRLTTRFAKESETDADLHEVLITHAYPIAWLVRHALDAPEARWLGLNSANAALTVIEYRPGLPPSLVLFNDMSHLPPDLQWTGFAPTLRP
ncbi:MULTISPECIES: histidine phosphatase family protein [unclassified Brevibacterium]|uniref:histidine phosphatase family protein n=1 Tax=unclassified Brevibacterium TaxID=2614124 RepID=UPI0010925C22|nr:histidine phosphatase family protein [Brevibacterium sp. S22]TGD31260.1 histidine phosphatase family protein [Brevibacterium sp. S22]